MSLSEAVNASESSESSGSLRRKARLRIASLAQLPFGPPSEVEPEHRAGACLVYTLCIAGFFVATFYTIYTAYRKRDSPPTNVLLKHHRLMPFPTVKICPYLLAEGAAEELTAYRAAAYADSMVQIASGPEGADYGGLKPFNNSRIAFRVVTNEAVSAANVSDVIPVEMTSVSEDNATCLVYHTGNFLIPDGDRDDVAFVSLIYAVAARNATQGQVALTTGELFYDWGRRTQQSVGSFYLPQLPTRQTSFIRLTRETFVNIRKEKMFVFTAAKEMVPYSGPVSSFGLGGPSEVQDVGTMVFVLQSDERVYEAKDPMNMTSLLGSIGGWFGITGSVFGIFYAAKIERQANVIVRRATRVAAERLIGKALERTGGNKVQEQAPTREAAASTLIDPDYARSDAIC